MASCCDVWAIRERSRIAYIQNRGESIEIVRASWEICAIPVGEFNSYVINLGAVPIQLVVGCGLDMSILHMKNDGRCILN